MLWHPYETEGTVLGHFTTLPPKNNMNKTICEGNSHTPGPSAGSGHASELCPSAHPYFNTLLLALHT